MINFLKYRWVYFTISAIVIGAGLLSIFRWGYIYSIDFTGGTTIDYRVDQKVTTNDVKKEFQTQKLKLIDVRKSGDQISLKAEPMDANQELKIRAALQKDSSTQITTLQFNSVGPTIGKESIHKTIIASILAIFGILLYMSFAFKGWKFAVAAILAMFHDFLVVMGTYSLISHFFGAEFDTLFVTAILTNMAFSVHDTIIIFDKIREYIRRGDTSHIEHDANRALSETLVRSLNNSATIMFMLVALILLGGSTIRFFVIALLVGTLTGAYSSPFIATPLLVWLEKKKFFKK